MHIPFNHLKTILLKEEEFQGPYFRQPHSNIPTFNLFFKKKKMKNKLKKLMLINQKGHNNMSEKKKQVDLQRV